VGAAVRPPGTAGVLAGLLAKLFKIPTPRVQSARGTDSRNGRSVADIVPIKAAKPAWKKPPQIRLSLGNLSLGDEILADRGADPAEETNR